MFSTVLALFTLAVGIIWWFKHNKNDKGLKIPGPMGIPILGNAHQLGIEQYAKFDEWSKRYGDIYKIRLGNKLALVISDPKMIKEIFTVEPAFAGRQIFEGLELYPNEPLGIVLSEGELWEVHRRFLLRQLRDFGFGKSSMEDSIIEEVNETISRFSSLQLKNGSVSDAKDIFSIAVVNSLFTILASKRYEHDDPKVLEIIKDSDRITNEIANKALFLLIPSLRFILPAVKGFDEIRDRNRAYYKSIADEHKETFDENNLRDFVDVYLKEMKAEKDKPESMFYGDRAERQLHIILADLHFAGSDTTSTTLNWGLCYLAKFQEAQKKLQKEIGEITEDNSRQVSLSDTENMPYTKALIDEILRFSSIIPNGVQHKALAGKYFQGYWVPKDTWIFPNLHYLHHNPSIWGDPENFRPERFLSVDGLTYKKNENLMPFQIGRRACIGEGLARKTLFLFITNIFQRFFISFDPKKPIPSLKPKSTFILGAEPYSVVLKDRLCKE